MTLKVRDEQEFNLSMNLNINYDFEYIEVTVTTWNKKAHTVVKKRFGATDFPAALAYYRNQEAFLFGKEEG